MRALVNKLSACIYKPDYSGGLTKSRNKPMIRTMMLRKPKSPVKTPSASVLVSVKYRSKAPMITRSSPKNFSARDSQKVSPSLMPIPIPFSDVVPT
jgi:hypothetical protein